MQRLVSEDADEGSDPDPDPDPALFIPRPPGLLYVPVRRGSAGGSQLLLARTANGRRTSIGYTTLARMTAVLGTGRSWIRLTEPALRALAEPLGAGVLTVDPQSAGLRVSGPAVHVPSSPPSSAPVRHITPGRPCARRAMDLSEATSV